MEKRVRTRIAPSPTGDPHVGTAYMALFNIGFSYKHGGDFILRIEDTDQTRYVEDSERVIFETLNWLGLNWGEGPDIGGPKGPYRQSERFNIYGDYAKKLVEDGEAYYCFCSEERLENLRERQKNMGKAPGYDGHCRSLSKEEVAEKIANKVPYVIRLKMPYDGVTILKDRFRGDVVFENDKIDDQILLKADGFPTYHLANVVDDHLMEITHVIRAEEWIPSTPKHIQLYKAFNWEAPEFIHMPLLRNADKTKISKRKNPVSLIWYKNEGYLKEGLVNFLGLMGYSFGENKEIFSLQEFKENFDIDKVSIGGPVFDLVKLGWVNNQHMRQKDLKELTDLAVPFFREYNYIGENISDKEFDTLKKIVELQRECCTTLREIAVTSEVYFKDEYSLMEATPETDPKDLKSVERLHSSIKDEIGKKSVHLFLEKIKSFSSDEISLDEAKKVLHDTLEEIGEGAGKVYMPLRAVLTGLTKGADLYNLIFIIGKERTLKRIEGMIKKYNI
ncbi:MAG: glutamate--tRNA ligase [Fusobacteriaceae bacterium]